MNFAIYCVIFVIFCFGSVRFGGMLSLSNPMHQTETVFLGLTDISVQEKEHYCECKISFSCCIMSCECDETEGKHLYCDKSEEAEYDVKRLFCHSALRT